MLLILATESSSSWQPIYIMNFLQVNEYLAVYTHKHYNSIRNIDNEFTVKPGPVLRARCFRPLRIHSQGHPPQLIAQHQNSVPITFQTKMKEKARHKKLGQTSIRTN